MASTRGEGPDDMSLVENLSPAAEQFDASQLFSDDHDSSCHEMSAQRARKIKLLEAPHCQADDTLKRLKCHHDKAAGAKPTLTGPATQPAGASKDPLFDTEAQSEILNLAHSATSTLKIQIYHRCFGKCVGIYYPARLVDNHSACIECSKCYLMLSPKRFVCHTHGPKEVNVVHWGFNSNNWHHYIRLSRKQKMNNLDDDELLVQFETLQSSSEQHQQAENSNPNSIDNNIITDKPSTNEFIADLKRVEASRIDSGERAQLFYNQTSANNHQLEQLRLISAGTSGEQMGGSGNNFHFNDATYKTSIKQGHHQASTKPNQYGAQATTNSIGSLVSTLEAISKDDTTSNRLPQPLPLISPRSLIAHNMSSYKQSRLDQERTISRSRLDSISNLKNLVANQHSVSTIMNNLQMNLFNTSTAATKSKISPHATVDPLTGRYIQSHSSQLSIMSTNLEDRIKNFERDMYVATNMTNYLKNIGLNPELCQSIIDNMLFVIGKSRNLPSK